MKRFKEAANRRGLRLPDPSELRVIERRNDSDPQCEGLEERISAAADANCNYVLVITDKNDSKIHGES